MTTCKICKWWGYENDRRDVSDVWPYATCFRNEAIKFPHKDGETQNEMIRCDTFHHNSHSENDIEVHKDFGCIFHEQV